MSGRRETCAEKQAIAAKYYTGWIESGKAVTAFDWIGLVLICFVLPAVLSTIFCEVLRKKGWIKEGDLKL